MSFNVWREHRSHAPWSERHALVAALIRYHRPDLIGAQEFLLPMIQQIEPLLPDYSWLGVGRDDGGEAGEFTPIFYRRDAFHLVDGATFWLAPEPDRPAKAWGAACPRIVTWAKFCRNSDGRAFFFFNTHFDHLSLRARQESARLLLRRIREIVGDDPVIVTGDLNCRENSSAYTILTHRAKMAPPEQASDSSIQLFDARPRSELPPIGPRKTWRGVLPTRIGAGRLDYIFVNRRVRVIQHAVLADHWDGRYASDHLPVAADVQLTSAEV